MSSLFFLFAREFWTGEIPALPTSSCRWTRSSASRHQHGLGKTLLGHLHMPRLDKMILTKSPVAAFTRVLYHISEHHMLTPHHMLTDVSWGLHRREVWFVAATWSIFCRMLPTAGNPKEKHLHSKVLWILILYKDSIFVNRDVHTR